MSSIPDQYARYLAEVAASAPAPEPGKPISVADAAIQAMREARVMIEEQRETIVSLIAALAVVESVYRKNCVYVGEPSSVLDAIQAAIAAAKARIQ